MTVLSVTVLTPALRPVTPRGGRGKRMNKYSAWAKYSPLISLESLPTSAVESRTPKPLATSSEDGNEKLGGAQTAQTGRQLPLPPPRGAPDAYACYNVETKTRQHFLILEG